MPFGRSQSGNLCRRSLKTCPNHNALTHLRPPGRPQLAGLVDAGTSGPGGARAARLALALPRDARIELVGGRGWCLRIDGPRPPRLARLAAWHLPQRRPLAGLIVGGAVGSAKWPRILRITTASVMKAMILISPPHFGHTSGSTS